MITRTNKIILITAVAFLALFIIWFVYAFILNHYNDKALFKALGIKYDASAIEYKAALGDTYAVTYIAVDKKLLEQRAKDATGDVFSGCESPSTAYCTGWIDVNRVIPTLKTNAQVKTVVPKKVMEAATGQGAVCRYRTGIANGHPRTDATVVGDATSGDGSLWASDTLCINPETGYAVYEKVRT